MKSDAKSKTSAAAAPVALVDQASFEMLPKGGNLWVKNAAKESALIAEMRKGAKLVIKAASLRGHQSIDTYSLTASPRRWSGCRRNARASEAGVRLASGIKFGLASLPDGGPFGISWPAPVSL